VKAVRIKLCGVRRAADALLCASAGADELGVVFAAGSKRRVTLAEAQAIRAALPAAVPLVGVFKDASLAELQSAAASCRFSLLQLHGTVPEGAGRLGIPLVRALQLSPESPPSTIEITPPGGGPPYARVLLDGPAGGSGLSFAWEQARAVRSQIESLSKLPIELFIAGGLHEGNVALAIAQAAPDGVDVASGIEGEDGFKDEQRVRGFVGAARAAPGR
jgi:phosphoribosylanthranilate isomerase